MHWRFLDTSTADVTELFDTVTVVLLAVATVYAWRRLHRSIGLLLGLALCVLTFQTFLPASPGRCWSSSRCRRVRLVDPRAPLARGLVLALFIPCGYFLIQRYVTAPSPLRAGGPGHGPVATRPTAQVGEAGAPPEPGRNVEPAVVPWSVVGGPIAAVSARSTRAGSTPAG